MAEVHSLFTLPQSLSRIHLPCARPSATAFKIEPSLQPLSYPIYSALSTWNCFPQSNMTSFLIILKKLPVLFVLKLTFWSLPSRCLTFKSTITLPFSLLLTCSALLGQTLWTPRHLPYLVRYLGVLFLLQFTITFTLSKFFPRLFLHIASLQKVCVF
jgi:hypothetical protein